MWRQYITSCSSSQTLRLAGHVQFLAVFRVVIQLRHVSLPKVSLRFYGSGTVTPPGLSRAWAAVGLGFLVLVRGFPRVSI